MLRITFLSKDQHVGQLQMQTVGDFAVIGNVPRRKGDDHVTSRHTLTILLETTLYEVSCLRTVVYELSASRANLTPYNNLQIQ